jgi:hypothetical protein
LALGVVVDLQLLHFCYSRAAFCTQQVEIFFPSCLSLIIQKLPLRAVLYIGAGRKFIFAHGYADGGAKTLF